MDIILGDALEEIKKLDSNSIDLIITDPPYNIGQSNKRTKIGSKIVTNKEAFGSWDNKSKIEYDSFIINILKESYRVLKDGGVIYMFTAREDNGYFIRQALYEGFTYLNQLIIIKNNPLPHFSKTNWRSGFEVAFYCCKGKRPKTFNFLNQKAMINYFNYNIGKKKTKHPTEKPLDFIKKLVLVSSNKGDIILDMFGGSGTTAQACLEEQRDFIIIENNKSYYEIINKRLSPYITQLPSSTLNINNDLVGVK